MMTSLLGTAGNPWADLLRMQREMDRLFANAGLAGRSRVFPPINIYQSDDAYLLRAELPGVDPAALEVTFENRELVLKGRREAPELEEGASAHRRERMFGTFARRFTLPDFVDGEKVEAHYDDGVLEVRLPKRPEAAPRQITVATS